MAYRWLGAWLLIAACSVGCGNDGSAGPRGSGSSGGNGGVGGSAGQSGSGGTAGTGGSVPTCTTSVLCPSCPADGFCDSADDCSVGSVCVESGCDDLGGVPVKQCVFAGGGACTSSAMCPSGRECLDVPDEGKVCVRTEPGCDSRFDCVAGFTCEEGSCVDRRVPCDLDEHCPMNHVCASTAASSFCVRIQVDCSAVFDCEGLAPTCADIDGVGGSECAGTFDPNDPFSEACTNDMCSDGGAPVCQAGGVGSTSQCGQYGLCVGGDCAEGFTCTGLWPDGRRECVPDGGSCSSYADCPVREVCASPREGGAPGCQVGYQP